MTFDLIACACLIFAGLLLVILSVIDLRVRLLPNIYVLPLALLGVVFHLTTSFDFLSSPHDMIAGGIIGFMILFLLRLAGNHYYGQDTLGLVDVKLMGAGGLWLGGGGCFDRPDPWGTGGCPSWHGLCDIFKGRSQNAPSSLPSLYSRRPWLCAGDCGGGSVVFSSPRDTCVS